MLFIISNIQYFLQISAAIKCRFSKDIPSSKVSKLLLYGVNEKLGKIHLTIPFRSFKQLFPQSTKEDFCNFVEFPPDDILFSVESYYNSENDSKIIFNINNQTFIKGLLLNKLNQCSEKNDNKEHIVLDFR